MCTDCVWESNNQKQRRRHFTKLAADVSDLLVKRYPSVNSRFLEAISKINNLLSGFVCGLRAYTYVFEGASVSTCVNENMRACERACLRVCCFRAHRV